MSDTDNNQPPPQPPTTFGDYLSRLPSFMPAAFPPRAPSIQPQPQPAIVQPQPQPPIAQPQPQPPTQPQPPAVDPTAGYPAGVPKVWPLPQQPGSFQRYAKAEKRDYDKWGTDHWGKDAIENYPDIVRTSHMPTPREAYNEIQSSGQRLENMAAPAVAGPAGLASRISGIITPFMDLISGGAYSPAFGKAQGHALANQKARLEMQREYYEQQRERMLDAADDAQTAHSKMLGEYEKVFSLYKNGFIDESTAEELIRALNIKHNHQALNGRLHDAGIGAVENYLHEEDKEFRNMGNGSATLRASDRRRREAAGLDPNTDLDREWSTDVGGGGAALRPGERPLPFRGPSAEAAAEAAAAEPGAPEPGSFNEQIAKKHHLTPSGLGVAHQIMRDGGPQGMNPSQAKGLARHAWPHVFAASADLGRGINDIANNKNLSGEQKFEEMEKIDPTMARDVKMLADYDKDSKDVTIKEGMRSHYESLAKSINPSYSPSKHAAAQKFVDPKSPVNQFMTKVSGLNQGALTVVDALANRDESKLIPLNVLDQLMQNKFYGGVEFKDLGAGLQQFNMAMAGISGLTGQPRVTPFKLLMERGETTASPRQIRNILYAEMRDAWAHIGNYQNQWEGLKRGSFAPGLEPSSWKGISSFLRSNPNTGAMPEDAPLNWQNVSKPGEKSAKRLTEDEKFKPLTANEARRLPAMIEKYRNDPRPEAQDAVKQWRLRMPRVENPPWEKVGPPYDTEAPSGR